MKFRPFVLPVIGAGCLTFGVVHVVHAQKDRVHLAPLGSTASHIPGDADGDTVAGIGLFEPASENIAVASHRAGIVAKVLVHAGERVDGGASLFCLDDRAAAADLRAREADVALARAQLERVVQQPRSEELPPLIAKVAAAKAHLDDADDLLRRTNHLLASGAVAEEQSVRAEQQQRGALAELQAAQADLDLKRAGAWKLDTSVAEVAIAQAMANAERARVELDLQCARAPLTATVLRVDVRAGEFVAAGPAPLINLGVIQPLHVRVDFDEVDIPRIGPSAAAYARIRGTDGAPLVLRFVRIEPSVLPKKFFSGDSAERLDTRVLQVIYALDNAPDNAFVGQQVDVFAKARPRR